MAARRLTLLAAGVALGVLAAPAFAQDSGADRRLDRLEQAVRTLQATVLQAQATGQPVVVRPEGPDPVVTALQDRVNDLEQTLQRVNGQAETLGFELQQARQATVAAETDRRNQLQGLNDRLARMESQINALTAAMAPPEPLAAGPNDARTAPDATGRAQAGDQGSLSAQLQPPPPPPPPNPGEAFTQARALFAANKFEEAGAAFEDFVARYPSNTRTPEAYYWMGESYFARRGYQTATAAYASALKSRPTTAWAPAAMARLAQSLANANQNAQACAALAEFDQRYAAKASAAVKANAQTARTRARCS